MGLELSITRLKALAKFAFGIGLPQVLLCTLAFTLFELPINEAVGTQLLNKFFGSASDLVNIRSLDEAIVIGAALSLSSSAFVLQLLSEKGELPTRFGSATLGILLLQDIAVIPLLVILPVLENGQFPEESMLPVLVTAGLKALLGLGALFLTGRYVLRKIFEIVADSRSPEAFVALCLLTVTGTSLITAKLGFSDSLGAFLAGALLAETNYRTQVEADIRPFRGLLLGLFFVTTGTSIDFNLLVKEWPNVLALLGGLLAIKTTIITGLSYRAGLTLSESIRTGLLLSQGGEFAFVVFSLANQLGVLPLELNRLLIIVVVLSMGLTPLLDAVGKRIADYIEGDTPSQTIVKPEEPEEAVNSVHSYEATEPVVIIGFGQMGQVLASFLSTPLSNGLGGDSAGWPYVSFDLDPRRVQTARKLGFNVLYGDGSRSIVLQAAGITRPRALMVMHKTRIKAIHAVEKLRNSYPGVPIYARAQDLSHLLELKAAGATDVVLENAETSLRMGSILLQGLGVMRDDVVFLRQVMRESMDLRAQEAFVNRNFDDAPVVGSFQDKVKQMLRWRNKPNSQNQLRQRSNEKYYDFLNSSSDSGIERGSSDEEDDFLNNYGNGNTGKSRKSPEKNGSSTLSSSPLPSSPPPSLPSPPLTPPRTISRGGNFLESVGGLAAIALAASPDAVASSIETQTRPSSSIEVRSMNNAKLGEYDMQISLASSTSSVDAILEGDSDIQDSSQSDSVDDTMDPRGVSICSLGVDEYDGTIDFANDQPSDFSDDDDENFLL